MPGRKDAAPVTGPGAGHYGRGPRGYRRSDERITDDLAHLMTEHGQLDATDVESEVQGGLVTLRGRVPDRDQKYLAEDLASSVRGVREVRNELRVARAPGGRLVDAGYDGGGVGGGPGPGGLIEPR